MLTVALPSVLTPPLQPEDAAPMQLASAYLRAERHTGSNFLEEILSLNFRRNAELAASSMMANSTCRRQRLSISADCYVPTSFFSGCDTRSDRAQAGSDFCCWKHGVACRADDYAPPTTVMVALVRSPYPFLLALHKDPYESNYGAKQMPFSEFLRQPWSSRPPYYSNYERAANPVELWVKKMRSYQNYTGEKVVVRTSDLFSIDVLEQKLSRLDSLGFKRAWGAELQYPEFTDDSDQSKWSGKFSSSGFVRAALATKQSTWLGEYTQSDIEFINSELERLGGFELLNWAGMNRVDNASAVDAAATHERAVRTRPTLVDAVSVFDLSSNAPRVKNVADGTPASKGKGKPAGKPAGKPVVVRRLFRGTLGDV